MRYYLFTIGKKYKLRAEWASISRFVKLYYFLFYISKTHKDNNTKRQTFDVIILGLALKFSRPYSHNFSYKKMPKIKGRRKA